MEKQQNPPMDPDTSEATKTQLDLAKGQGEAFGKALEYMVQQVANTGGKQHAGEYIVGYAVEDAEGMYRYRNGQLDWQNPDGENAHVEITVCDAADGRFVPAVKVMAALITPGAKNWARMTRNWCGTPCSTTTPATGPSRRTGSTPCRSTLNRPPS